MLMNHPNEEALARSLAELPAPALESLQVHGFSAEWLLREARASKNGTRSNVVRGTLEKLPESELLTLPEPGSARYDALHRRGEEALRAGKCALAILAGGMATRMGGVVKALVPAVHGKTFLELRLQEQASLASRYGRMPPLWLMTSHATHDEIARALGSAASSPHLSLFRQGLSVRLDEHGQVFRTRAGEPSLYAPGHGDFVDCLKQSGLLEAFVARGGKYVLSTNLDNLGGGLDPVLIGMHIESECAVTCELVEREEGDKGSIPVRLDGRPVVLEDFRLPKEIDPTTVSVFSINNFGFDAEQLLQLDMDWTYFEVVKNVEGKRAVQYERLINEVTFGLPTQYVRVPRAGTRSRFLPVKDHEEHALRQRDLDAIAAARGMLPASTQLLALNSQP
jgi:UTP--glucose-1-phosphate uridylyltransferase